MESRLLNITQMDNIIREYLDFKDVACFEIASESTQLIVAEVNHMARYT